MQTLAQESAEVLRRALKGDGTFDGKPVISTMLSCFNNQIPPKMFRHVVNERALEPQNPHHFNLLTHPKTLRYRESTFDPLYHVTTDDYWCVELAQVAIPVGSVGILTSIEQVLRDINGAFYPTSINHWGSPDFVQADVANCRWYLTLDNYDGLLPARYNVVSAVPILPGMLPGSPHPDLFEISSLWYPAHSTSSKIKLVIPQNHVLRFFFWTPPTVTYQWQVSGRLRAQVQSTFSSEAAENVRCF